MSVFDTHLIDYLLYSFHHHAVIPSHPHQGNMCEVLSQLKSSIVRHSKLRQLDSFISVSITDFSYLLVVDKQVFLKNQKEKRMISESAQQTSAIYSVNFCF